MRQVVRVTATKILRSDNLVGDEKAVASGILLANPDLGFPHVVRCDWCHETRTLFNDENDGPFSRTTPRGWRCEPCDVRAISQEIRF